MDAIEQAEALNVPGGETPYERLRDFIKAVGEAHPGWWDIPALLGSLDEMQQAALLAEQDKADAESREALGLA